MTLCRVIRYGICCSLLVLLSVKVFASPLLGKNALFASGASSTEYTGPTAGQFQNVSNGTQTVNSIQMAFFTGSVVNGSCVGTNTGGSAASAGTLSFQTGDYLHLSPVAVYNAVVAAATSGAYDPSDTTCVQLTILDTTTAASSLNFFNPYSSDGTTIYPVGTSASFDIVCDALSTSCITSEPTLPVAVMQNRIAVGSYVDVQGYTYPLTYNSPDDGNNWTLSTTLPQPGASANPTDTNQLLASACGVNGLQCVAVGNFNAQGVTGTQPLATYSTDGGINWSASNSIPTLDTNNSLNGVACDSTGVICNAVGYWHDETDSPNYYIPLSYYTIDGGDSWTQSSAIPTPAGAGNAYLYGIACSETGLQCSAVGNYTNTNGQIVPLSYSSANGGRDWALSTTLPPAQMASTNLLSSVACDSDTGLICTAVGYYYNAGLNVPLAYTSTNGGVTWVIATTLPAADTHNDNLTSVSCGSDGLFCSAVGYNDNHQALSYYSTDSGVIWTKNGLTQPIGSNPQLMNVFCLGAGPQCSATGFYTSSGVVIPLSYLSDSGGRVWTAGATQPAANSGTSSQLYPQTGNP